MGESLIFRRLSSRNFRRERWKTWEKEKSTKKLAPKESIQELSNSRNGGQVALRGYSYQFLYSCYLMLFIVRNQRICIVKCWRMR